MNNCILMVDIVQDPQLRYTAESQIPIAEMMVQVPSTRPDDPPSMLKVVGWGNLAQDISQKYHQGDRIIIEGRLGMMMIDRPEGFKEKRAELTAKRVYSVLGVEEVAESSTPSTASSAAPNNVVPLESRNRPATPPAAETSPTPQPTPSVPQPEPTAPADADDPDYDPIPF